MPRKSQRPRRHPRRLAAERQGSTEGFERLFQINPLACVIVSEASEGGRVIAVNPAFAALSGQPAATLIGATLAGLGLKPAPPELDPAPAQAADRSPVRRHRMQTHDGRELHLRMDVVPTVHRQRPATLHMLHDVSERCRERVALRSSEARLSAIMNSTQVMIGETSVDGVLIEVNRAALEAGGTTRESVLGTRFEQTAWFRDLPLSQAQIADAVGRAGRGETVRHDIEYRTPTGELGASDFTLHPLRDETGHIVSLIVSGIDVSARRHAEQALRVSEQRLRTRVDNIAGFIGEVSVDGILLDVNQAALDAGDVRRQDVIGKPLEDTVWFSHSEQARQIARVAVAKAQRGEAVRQDIEVRTANGKLMPVDFMLMPALDEQGKVSTLIPSAIDISDRQAALQQLQHSRGLLDAALSQARMALWEFDPQCDQFILSDRFFELLGSDAGREGGYRLSSEAYMREFCHPEDQSWVKQEFRTAIKSAQRSHGFSFAYRQLRRDGTDRYIASRFDVVRDAKGRAINLHGAIQDVTEQTLAEQELRAQRDMQSMLKGAAAGLLEAPTARMDGAIDEVLRQCAELLGADRANLLVYSNDGQRMRTSNEWCAEGIPARKHRTQNASSAIDPWLRAQLNSASLVIISDIAGLPIEAASERRYFESIKVHSIIAIALHSKGRVSGYIGFHAIRQARNWTALDGSLLKVLSEIVGSALNRQRAEHALRLLAETNAPSVEGGFVTASVEALAKAMGVRMALVATRNAEDPSLATTVAFWNDDRIVDNITYALAGSPCERVLENLACVYRDKVAQQFPQDHWLVDNAIESYVGIPLLDESGAVMGHLALLDKRPLPDDPELFTYLTLFADRIAADINRRSADKALRQSEMGLRATLDATRDGILAVGLQGQIRFGNRRMAEMWHFPADALSATHSDRGLLQAAAVQLREPQAFLDKVQQLYLSDAESEDLLEFADGRFFERYSKPLLEAGSVAGRVWSFHDITVPRQLQAELLLSRNLLDQAMGAAEMAAWDFDLVTGIFVWNDRFYALFGTTVQREGGYRMAAGRYLDDFCHPDDRHLVQQAVADAMASPDTGRRHTVDYRIIRRDTGAVREVSVNYRIASDDNGAPARAWGALQDVTDRRQLTRELGQLNVELERRVEERTADLRDQQAAAEVMLENLSEGVVACDSRGNLTLFNRRAREWYGCDPITTAPEDWAGRFEILVADGESPLALDQHPLTRARAGERVRNFEMQIRHSGEAARQVMVNGGPIFDDRGASLGAMIAIHDVSERTRQIEDRVARERAEQASRAKSGFLAAMSHEIRTPMNAVLGLAEVLGCGDLTPHQADLVTTIRQSAGQLLRLIDDILDFSKIEAGRLELENSPFEVVPLIEGVVKTLATSAVQKKVSLRMFIAPSVPPSLLGDETALRQLIYNLLGNAIKFSSGLNQRPGRVEIRLEHGDPDAQRLRLSIRDNGIGMAPDVLDKLFLPFVQGEASTTRRFGGTGLGLAISSRIVELMGGSIAVTSREGVGSTFSVSLPCVSEGPGEAQAGVPAQSLAGVRCGLVDGDQSYAADDLQIYLESAGAVVRRLATEELGTLAAAGWVGLLGLPGDALRPVLLRPPGPLAGDASGLGQVLIGKPHGKRPASGVGQPVSLDADALSFSELVHAVSVASGRTVPAHRPPPPPEDPAASTDTTVAPSAGHLILVAEDDPINQLVITHQLHQLGHVAQIAADGAEALRLWRTGKYAMLVADLHMPLLDGYELTRAIRAEERRRGEVTGTAPAPLPILALTANALRGEEHHAYAVGMNAYLTKPISLAMLKQRLQEWLPSPSPSAGAAPLPAPAEVEITRAEALFDVEVPLRLVGDDPQVLHELLGDYVDASSGMVISLQQAAADGDFAAARSIAHNFKSSARTVGASPLASVCADIEDAGRSGDRAAVARHVDHLLPLHHRVIDAINHVISSRSA